MAQWKDEDIATTDLIVGYLQEFKEGIFNNPDCQLAEAEKTKVEEALEATQQFCLELLVGKKRRLYMHDLILMAVGYYGGFLSALDKQINQGSTKP
jgi:hypothetical protein